MTPPKSETLNRLRSLFQEALDLTDTVLAEIRGMDVGFPNRTGILLYLRGTAAHLLAAADTAAGCARLGCWECGKHR